jgi:long-subunit acyl-CoA synthetase (AMP-forming)
MKDEQTSAAPAVPALRARTLCEAFQITAAERPDAGALRNLDGTVAYTFAEYAARVRAVATGLHALGVRRGDTVGLMLLNRPEFNVVDTGAMHLGAVPFSIYNTLSPEQIAHLFDNAGNRVIITERRFLPNVLAARSARLEHVVLVDGPAEGALTLAELMERPSPGFDFDAAWQEVTADDVVTLIYTSGTTGPPKAVQLTHASVLFQCRALQQAARLERGGRGISYLPSAHVGDRAVGYYMGSHCLGTEIVSITDHKQVGMALLAVRPPRFGGVPRVWEKLKAGLETAGVRDPSQLPEAAKAAVRARVGLENLVWCLSGAAPIPVDVLQYFLDLGVPLVEGWGMSEASGMAFINPVEANKPGTVGKPLPGVEVRIAGDGELLLRAPLVMKGYRGDPEKTAEAIDAEGWLHTGDIATIDDEGYVRIVDRKKEIIINSAGKNMSPANIEQQLRSASPLIAHAVCIGDRRPYNVALLVLDPEVADRWASERGLPGRTVAELLRHPQLTAVIGEAVERANAALSRVEQVKRFAILDGEWLPGGTELTPTMKLRRRPIFDKYAAEIERLYE